MSKENEFSRQLDKLFHARTHWLRILFGGKKPGPPPLFGRRKVSYGIAKLQTIASDAFARKLSKAEFSKFTTTKRAWHVKGHGRPEKRRKFDQWFEQNVGNDKCIYVFWKSKACVYVGRTGNGGSRPQNHFEKFWFGGVTRVDIYPVRQRSQIPKLECLAIHRFQPMRNKSKASSQKWQKKCPMCKIHRDIRNELRSIFRLK
jgi:hypothetical protein